jgi:DNA-binding transcriptional regulator of glucitol operon
MSVGLAWWQWDRFESATGTIQNLSYVLQWPLFGLFPAFMVYRIRKLRRAAAEADEVPETSAPATEWGRRPVTEVPAPRSRPAPVVSHVSDDDEDDELAAYNRYLAELNARDLEDRQKGKP